MARKYDHDRWEFVEACKQAGMTGADAQAIARDANTVQRWAVRECSDIEYREEACEERGRPVYGMVGGGDSAKPMHRVLKVPAGSWLQHRNIEGPGPSWYSIIERPTGPWAERRIRARVAKMGAGWEVETQGDPRGECTKLRIPGNRGNSFGGDGLYCVPTRNY